MKCPGCGADYSARLLKCPYCGTVNEEAVRRENDKEKRRKLLKRLRIRTAREAGPRITLQVLNRILAVMAGIWVLLFAGICLFFYVESKADVETGSLSMEEHLADLEALKAEGDFAGIGGYLSRYELSMYDEGMEEYWQLYEIYGDMRDFWEMADEEAGLSAEESASDTWLYRSLAGDVIEIWRYGSSPYEWEQVMEGNKEQYRQWKEEVRLYLRIRFGMNEEELGQRLDNGELSYSYEEELGAFLKERAAEYGE